ncbi:MAG: MarR family winged helix-turn-helix transcriptional regulator [Bacteroidota bacterium]
MQLRLFVHTNMKEEEKSYFCNCLYFSASSFARNMTKLADEAFASTGWAPSYAFVLMTVNRHEEGVSPSIIAKEMHLTPSTVTRLLDKLEQKDMITRHSEGKASIVKPTRKSKAINEDLVNSWSNLFKNYNEMLGEQSAQKLAAELYDSSEKIK